MFDDLIDHIPNDVTRIFYLGDSSVITNGD